VEPPVLPSFVEDIISHRVLCIIGKNSMQGVNLITNPPRKRLLLDRINKLEQMLGKLTLENEFLKKALQNTLKEQEKKESSLPLISPLSKVSKGGAN